MWAWPRPGHNARPSPWRATDTEIDPDMVERITGTLDAFQVAWSRLAKRWGELTNQDGRADPVLSRAPARSERRYMQPPALQPVGPRQIKSLTALI